MSHCCWHGGEGHLFITVLAYQLVQTIRRKLELAGDPVSWTRLREILSVQQRVTATFRQRDGRIAVTMNIGPLVLTNIGPPSGV